MLVRRHQDGEMPELFTDFLKEYTQDSYLISSLASSCPQAVGNELLFILLNDFELSEESTGVSDYNKDINHRTITRSHTNPTKTLVETMITRQSSDDLKMIGMITSFVMMRDGDQGLSLIALMYDPESKSYDYVDINQSEDALKKFDAFYEKIQATLNAQGRKFISFQEIVDFCNAQPDTTLKFLPMTSAMIELSYSERSKLVSVNKISAFYPDDKGLMHGYNPMIASAKSCKDAERKNQMREFYFNRLGDHSLPQSMTESVIRGQRISWIKSEAKTHEGYGDDCQINVDRAIYEHEQNMGLSNRFLLALRCAFDAYRIGQNPIIALK